MLALLPVMIAAGLLVQTPPPARVNPKGARDVPLYRKLKPGEQRAEGLLRRITCPGKGPVTFVVKQKDNTVAMYTAPQLTSVDFIVYRKDFQGPMTCQGFGAGEPVYVTWKPDGKTPRAIAIEFLPK